MITRKVIRQEFVLFEQMMQKREREILAGIALAVLLDWFLIGKVASLCDVDAVSPERFLGAIDNSASRDTSELHAIECVYSMLNRVHQVFDPPHAE